MSKYLEPYFPPFELRVLQLLGDGKPHTKREIRGTFHSVTEESLLRILYRIRGKLRDLGPYTISLAAESQSIDGMTTYQLVRYIPATLADVNRGLSHSVVNVTQGCQAS